MDGMCDLAPRGELKAYFVASDSDEARPVGIDLGDGVVGGVGVEVGFRAVGIGLDEAARRRAVVAGVHVGEAEAELVVPLDIGGTDVEEPETEVCDRVVGGRGRRSPGRVGVAVGQGERA